MARRCSSCRADVADGMRFCGQCGTRVDDAPSVAAERRQLSVMFCDLAGSTQLSGTLDPEDLREVLREYHDAATRAIREYDGFVAEYLGDGLVVYFGYPEAHEDDAERAARAGLAIVTNMEGVNAQLEGRLGLHLGVRIGIHTGLVVVGEVGARDVRDVVRIVGETPNIAARIQGEAPLDGVVVTAATRSLLGGGLRVQSIGHRSLKGVEQPLEVFHVVGAGASPNEAPAPSSIDIVDRVEPLALLRARWEAVRDGSGGAVVAVTGEPGIGKSKLIEALREVCVADGGLWLHAPCSAYHSATPLHPIAALGLTIPDPVHAPGVSPVLLRRRTHAEVLRAVRALGGRGPVVLAVEDVHWADPSTLELLALAGEAPPDGILVVTTQRPGTPTTHAATCVELAPLADADAETLVERAAGGALPPALRRELAARTDGVPLFATELVRTLVETDEFRDEGGVLVLRRAVEEAAIPMRLQDSLMARIDRLGPAKPLAQLAAVLGRSFRRDVLAAVSGEWVDVLFDQLLASGVIEDTGREEEEFAFSHALLRDVAYGSLLRATRREHHGRIAAVLLERFSTMVEEQPQLVAHHLTESGAAEEAIGWWRTVADAANRRSASAEAVAALRHARDLLAQVAAPDPSVQLSVHAALGAALAASKGYGDEEAAASYRSAQALTTELPSAPELFPVLFGLVAYFTARGEFVAARAAGDQLLASADNADDDGLRIEAHYSLGMVDLYTGALDAAVDHLARGIELYDPEAHHGLAMRYVFDPGVACHRSIGIALHLLGRVEEARANASEAVELAARLEHPFSHASALVFAAIVGQLDGDRAGVERATTDALEIAEGHGYPFWSLSGHILHGWAAGGAEGRDEAVVALDRYRTTGSQVLLPYWYGVVAAIHDDLGEVEAAEAATNAAEAVELATGEVCWRGVRAASGSRRSAG